MIKSKLSFWFFHKLLALYILFTIISICLNVIEPEKPKGDYGFNLDGFIFPQIWATLVLIILFLITYLFKKEVIINSADEIIAINTVHSSVKKTYKLSQITNMIWENKNTTYNLRFKKESTNQKSFTLSFSDGNSLHIDGNDYSNFFEIQGFLLTYCNKHDIIRISPLNTRKRSRFRFK